ncbi:hypothetical protein EB796_016937 [Bugula neritina]|uniref:Reverse transcriptase domain-containing protein n=1 Tax=Bugula neritina TaxID=10212 RepID=A0A7J7JGJ1_BUGNE|nr:hypothetical protein EB796_016937 [Bugula neritina]
MLCAVPGRDIRDGTLMIRDVIQYVQDKHGKAILMSLDQKKAFDAVDRDFLFKTLEKFGVPTRLSAILKTLYTDTFTKIQVNGHLSESVALERGVRQGCPLSPTLYVLYVQMFVNFIAENPRFTGVRTTSNNIAKLTAYADDLLFFCNDEYDVAEVFESFEYIKQGTGSMLNTNKTQLLPIGSATCVQYQQYVVERMKVCGITFCNLSFQAIAKINFDLALRKICKRAAGLKNLSCTIRGKVLLANTVLFPVLYYAAATYLDPSSFRSIRKTIYSFLYGEGKREVFPRRIVELSREKGGLGMENVEKRCQAIFFYNSVLKPGHGNFDHQRLPLFTYYLSQWFRNLPQGHSNQTPHSFHKTESATLCLNIWQSLTDHQIVLAQFLTPPSQLYCWLTSDDEQADLKTQDHSART